MANEHRFKNNVTSQWGCCPDALITSVPCFTPAFTVNGWSDTFMKRLRSLQIEIGEENTTGLYFHMLNSKCTPWSSPWAPSEKCSPLHESCSHMYKCSNFSLSLYLHRLHILQRKPPRLLLKLSSRPRAHWEASSALCQPPEKEAPHRGD